MNELRFTRRNALLSSLAATALFFTGRKDAAACATCGCSGKQGKKSMKPKNSDFYDAKGAFHAEKAKQAYFEMMKRFGYPIADVLRSDQFWVCDFVQRDFASLGMGGIFWINEKDIYGKSGTGAYDGKFKDQPFGYLGHDIFLLPGQALPEHYHIGGPEGYGPKMESWQVRYGDIHLFGEHQGPSKEVPVAKLPERDRPWGFGESWFQSKYVVHRTAKSGQIYSLKDPESCHFMRAGSQGAIVTEYATYHNHVAFTKPGMAFDNSKAK